MSIFLNQPATILALDTSCDDTAAAVVKGRVVLSNIVASQILLHRPYGGVYPTIAKQAHLENWPAVVNKALKQAGASWDDLDALAVTVGPGLAPALEVGITAAKQLAIEHQLPLISVNHLEAHAWSSQVIAKSQNWQTLSSAQKAELSQLILPNWPILGIVVSGGNSLFVEISGFGQYKVLGKTLDDAAGECLDKVGRMLSLGYPAGPAVEEFAKLGDASQFKFPLPMTATDSFDMSFSGLKTHARNVIEKLTLDSKLDQKTTYDFCAGLQTGVFRHLTHKLTKLLTFRAEENQPFKQVWLGGGVAANMTLRQTLRTSLKPFGLNLAAPYNKRLCGDNAAMIGLIGALKFDLNQIEPDYVTVERQPRLTLD
jgi:N6-L-threonylcarbamoyladenine synthase